jgi:hypothetical protein
MSEAPVEKNNDPFTPENAPAVQLIVLMRIYDVLLGLFAEANKEHADKLVELHNNGGVLGPLPWLDLTSKEDT